MKFKILTTIILLALVSTMSFGQLRIDPNGSVGMGITPDNPGYKLLIKGDLALTTFPQIPPPLSRYTELRFKVGNGTPGTEIGTPTGEIAFWASEVGYNNLYAHAFISSSDIVLKRNIHPIDSGLGKIMQIQARSFIFKIDTINNKTHYGFIAQEIEQVIPGITDTVKGIHMLDYNQVIPFLVKAVQEQQAIIDSLRHPSNSRMGANNGGALQINVALSSRKIVLDQNSPNPFKDQTTITYFIPNNTANAMIVFIDMDGSIIKEVPIHETGKGQLNVYASDLSSGIYTYSIIADGITLDTKKMIKTK